MKRTPENRPAREATRGIPPIQIGEDLTRALVIGLQHTDLTPKQQLTRLEKFESTYSERLTSKASDYLTRQLEALSDFCKPS